MEIKRRLTAIGKTLNPQVESMNVASEMNRMLDRFEELVRYAQEKIDRSAERKGQTIGKMGQEARAKAAKEIEDTQQAESDENQKDQKESWEERNKILNKSRRDDDQASEEVTGHDPENIQTAVPVAEPMPDMTKKPTHPKKKAKQQAKKKK